ncbi:MAG: hypothetical protein ACREAM_23715, partial [Blastocatellia bacterium]
MGETDAAGFADLCIVTAVNVEFKIAAGLLSGKSFSEEPPMKICRGFFGARRITVLQSGMGAVGFAERLAKHLANNRYDALMVVGLAGGIDPKLRVGDAVLYDLCYDARAIEIGRLEQPAREPAREPTREEAAAIASDDLWSDFLFEALTKSALPFVRAPGVTVNRIITEAKDKLALGARYGAVAVDMETYEALIACARLDLPAATLRVISDEAGRDILDFNPAYDANDRMNDRINAWRMAVAMMARPFATFRFILSVRRALKS